MSRPSPASWRTISRLLDEVLDLPDEARPAWLSALAERAPEAAAAVVSWLDEYAVMDADGFLEDRPGAAPAPPLLAGLEVGAYRLVEPIGQGGMGTVWLAERRDGRFDQRVAVKLLNAALMDAAGTERFAREAGILARLTHPSISRLLDAGVSSLGAPFLVLEHVTGVAIDRYCDEQRLPIRERLYLFLDVLAPVAHAHANLIVHRDLKPANVLVTPDRHVKLLDFGIAKLLPASPDGSTVPVTKDNALTPAYAAPEQLTGGSITTATDVYALGVLLYQLVSGRHPSVDPAMTPAALIEAVVHLDPPAPADAVARVPPSGGPSADDIASARSALPARLRQELSGDLGDHSRQGAQEGARRTLRHRRRPRRRPAALPAPPADRRPARHPPLPRRQVRAPAPGAGGAGRRRRLHARRRARGHHHAGAAGYGAGGARRRAGHRGHRAARLRAPAAGAGGGHQRSQCVPHLGCGTGRCHLHGSRAARTRRADRDPAGRRRRRHADRVPHLHRLDVRQHRRDHAGHTTASAGLRGRRRTWPIRRSQRGRRARSATAWSRPATSRGRGNWWPTAWRRFRVRRSSA